MITQLWLMALLAILSFTLLFYFLFFKIIKNKFKQAVSIYSINYKDSPLSPYEFISCPPKTLLTPPIYNYKLWSNDWKGRFNPILETLVKEKITSIYLMHGTFAGNDPADMLGLLKKYIPLWGKSNELIFTDMIKSKIDKLGDLGNFTEEYRILLEKAFGENIPCINLNWSSANHHVARLKGIVECLTQFTDNHQHGDKVLILGHSHAGQLLVLLNHIITSKYLREYYFKLLELKITDEQIKLLQSLSFDIVTLGAPLRYLPIKNKNFRYLHFIHHNGKEALSGNVKGIPTTQAGDYIQQLALHGSDALASLLVDRKLNAKLMKILGSGNNVLAWNKNLKHKRRVPSFGKTILINYGVVGEKTNFHKTLFGHGVYTQIEYMFFQFNLLTEQLYYDKYSDEPLTLADSSHDN